MGSLHCLSGPIAPQQAPPRDSRLHSPPRSFPLVNRLENRLEYHPRADFDLDYTLNRIFGAFTGHEINLINPGKDRFSAPLLILFWKSFTLFPSGLEAHGIFECDSGCTC